MLWNLEVKFGLQSLISIDCSGMEKNWSFGWNSIITSCIKVNLSVAKNRDINGTPTNFFVSADVFLLLCFFGEGDIPFHQINLGYNCHKFVYRNLKLTFSQDSYLFFLLINFVKKTDPIFLFVQLPLSFWKLLIRLFHIIIFFLYSAEERFEFRWKFMCKFCPELTQQLISFINFVFLVSFQNLFFKFYGGKWIFLLFGCRFFAFRCIFLNLQWRLRFRFEGTYFFHFYFFCFGNGELSNLMFSSNGIEDLEVVMVELEVCSTDNIFLTPFWKNCWKLMAKMMVSIGILLIHIEEFILH